MIHFLVLALGTVHWKLIINAVQNEPGNPFPARTASYRLTMFRITSDYCRLAPDACRLIPDYYRLIRFHAGATSRRNEIIQVACV